MNPEDQQRLSYLNLETSNFVQRRSIDDIQIYCFSKDQRHKHKFHSEHTHLNALSDICHTTLCNLDYLNSSVISLLSKVLKNQKTQKDRLDIIEEKLEYLHLNFQKPKNKKYEKLENDKKYDEILSLLKTLQDLILS